MIDNNIITKCITDGERKICMEWLKCNKNTNQTAINLNVTEKHIKKIIHRVNKRNVEIKVATGIGDSCPIIYHDSSDIAIVQNNCMDVKSTSTLYNSQGKVINKWVKEDTSKNQLKKLVKNYIDEYSKSIPKYVPFKEKPYGKYENKLILYPLADVHLGMLAWKPETGNEYNTKIANETVRDVVTKIIDRSPSCESCIIANLGDFLHVDNQVNQTERSGNILDCDGRYAKIMQYGIKLMRYFIEYALQKHDKVTVINCIGNHDDLGSLWLSAALSNIYENEKRLVIKTDPTQRHYYMYGVNLLGFTHGSDVKTQQLPIIMATENKLNWGITDNHYWYTGHWHNDRQIEVGDCKVESFRAICAKDAWSTSKGYLTGRDMKAILIDPCDGECERYTLKI